MPAQPSATDRRATRPDWYRSIAQHGRPNRRKALWQLVNTFVPYLALWLLMIVILQRGYAYWMILPLILVAAGLLVRIFIFFHDCGHGSFFASRRANAILGYVCGILTFTPYHDWRHAHAIHHATAANLDRRGVGDIWTLTLDEYLTASKLKRLTYRLFRHPLVMFGLGPIFIFLISHRFPHRAGKKRERYSVLWTNLAILIIIVIASLTIGLKTYVLIQFPLIVIAGVAGIWLFYVQHQFEGVYWARQEAWDPVRAALAGSSYYKLPRLLQWFTGNIGLHHIHHARPRIPNYNLQSCQDETPALQAVKPLTWRASLKSLNLKLWDESRQRMIGFGEAKTLAQRG